MTGTSERVIKIFIDFDGTITKQDIGEEFFLHFGNRETAENIIKEWEEGLINSRIVWERLFESLPEISIEQAINYIDTFSTDDYFSDFLVFCKENNFELMVLSDGFDLYIDRVLEKAGTTNLPRRTNKIITKNGRLSPVFPHTDEECIDCANCKRNHILENSADTDYTIYIGDGYSDTCPAQYCDFIFAKSSLLKYCEKNRISYYPYNNLKDVIERLKELNSRKRLKKRHQADLKRKETYKRG